MTMPVSDEERAIIRNFVELVSRRKCCLTCQHFDEDREGCALYDMNRPPARIVAYGCPSYLENPPF